MAWQIFGEDDKNNDTLNYVRVSPEGGLYVTAIDSNALSATLELSGQVQTISSDLVELSGNVEVTDLTIFELKNAVKEAQSTYFTSGRYDGDDQPTSYETWTDETMTTKLFTQTLTWVSGNLTESVLVDETASKTLSSVFYYTAGGNLDRYKEVLI